jgi:hypothetical protein
LKTRQSYEITDRVVTAFREEFFFTALFVKKNKGKKKKKGKYIYFCINATHNSSMNINNLKTKRI